MLDKYQDHCCLVVVVCVEGNRELKIRNWKGVGLIKVSLDVCRIGLSFLVRGGGTYITSSGSRITGWQKLDVGVGIY